MKKSLVLTIVFVFACGITLSSIMASAQEDYNIPAWIKNNAAWWSEGQIDDASFVSGIKYMIENGIMKISQGDTQAANDDLYQENQELASLLAEYQEANDGFAENEGVLYAEIDSLTAQLQGDTQAANDDLYQENQELASLLAEYQEANDGFAENEGVLYAEIDSLTAQLQAAQSANTAGSSSVQKIQDNGNFVVVYFEPSTAFGNDFEQTTRNWGYFEDQAQWLNSVFRLPYDVGIVLGECGASVMQQTGGAFYDHPNHQIIMCYEFMQEQNTLFYQYYSGQPGWEMEASHLINFVFYHELGHTLIDVYELPTTGPEENAADSFSSYVMADFTPGTFGQDAIYSAGTWFLILSENESTPYWDTHSLNIQRYFNISCFSYGSNPSYNQDLVDDGWLPVDRAKWCDKEYTQQKNSWNKILQPFFK